jgi:hypothetical protein
LTGELETLRMFICIPLIFVCEGARPSMDYPQVGPQEPVEQEPQSPEPPEILDIMRLAFLALHLGQSASSPHWLMERNISNFSPQAWHSYS